MATKVSLKTTFEAAKTIEPIYTGGDISADSSGQLVATCVEEDVLVVNVKSGSAVCRIEGDGEAVTSLCLSPNASNLVVCSRSLSVRIYNLNAIDGDHNDRSRSQRAELLKSIKPHNSPVVSSTIDRSGSILATGFADGTVKVWDIQGGYASHTFHGHSGVVSALKLFYMQSESTQAKSGTSTRSAQQPHSLSDLDQTKQARLHDVLYLASGAEDGKIRIWNLVNRKSVSILDSHVSLVKALQFSEDQHQLLSASRDRTIIIWDASTWKPRKVIPALEVLETAGFLNNGILCYSGGENGNIRVWNAATGKEITPKQAQRSDNDGIVSIIQNSHKELLISAHRDQTLKFHSFETLQNLQSTILANPLPVIRIVSGNYDEVIDMACVGKDRSLLAIATNTESVKILSIGQQTQTSRSLRVKDQSQQQAFGADVAILEGHSDVIICMDTDWSGCWLATGAKDNSARLWRIDSEASRFECMAILLGHAESIGAIALPRSQPSGASTELKAIDQPPDFLITGSQDKTVKRWDLSKIMSNTHNSNLSSGTKALYTRVAHEKDINALDVSPVAPLFASASQDRTIKIWSLEDGSVTGILRGHKRGVWSIRFSPAGTPPIHQSGGESNKTRGLLVSGSGDRTVKVWSLSTYTCLFTFEGHSNSVLKVIWLQAPQSSQSEDSNSRRESSNNQPLIASASSDTLIKLWSPYATADSNHLLATLDNHSDRVWALATPFSATNKSTQSASGTCPYPLISGAADATLTFWKDTTVETASSAAQKVTQRIEEDQLLQSYIHAKDYREVITIALTLNHPGRLLRAFEDVITRPEIEKDKDSITGSKAVDEVLGSLSGEQIHALLERVRDWNTNARTAPVAQRVLNCLLKSYPASTFLEMAKNRKVSDSGKGMKEVLRALEVYTERHYKHMEDLVDESYLLEYTLREMDEIAGTVGVMDWSNTNGHSNALSNGDIHMV